MRAILQFFAMLLVMPCVAVAQGDGRVADHSVAWQDGATLRARVDAVRDGDVRLAFPARDGVCGNGTSWIQTGPNSYTGGWSGRQDVDYVCDAGPVRVVLTRQRGRTTELHTSVGGTWRDRAGVTDLGTVPAAAAVAVLLAEIERSDEEPAKSAMLPLTIAAGEVPWIRLLDVARDQTRPADVRKQALFWTAQAAGAKAASDMRVIARDDPDVEVRTQAVFALSRRADGVEHLLAIARTSTDREVKRSAYFWLGQSKDPRATELFAEVLGRP